MTTSAAQAFDFIYGRWLVHNRKLRNSADPECDEWVELPATLEAVPVLGGGGHIEQITAPDAADGAFVGMTLRLFDPNDHTWHIWWSSTRAPGRLDPPMIGRMTLTREDRG